MVPSLSQGDYNTAIPLGVRQIAQVIAIDAGVTLNLSQPVHQYHRQQAPVQISLMELLLGGGVILLILFFLVKNWQHGPYLLSARKSDGRRRRRLPWRDVVGAVMATAAVFGGFGGGGSGGGGASGDY